MFVDSASGAVNSVLRSLLYDATNDDVVVYFHTVYGMVRTVVEYMQLITNLTVVQVLEGRTHAIDISIRIALSITLECS